MSNWNKRINRHYSFNLFTELLYICGELTGFEIKDEIIPASIYFVPYYCVMRQ